MLQPPPEPGQTPSQPAPPSELTSIEEPVRKRPQPGFFAGILQAILWSTAVGALGGALLEVCLYVVISGFQFGSDILLPAVRGALFFGLCSAVLGACIGFFGGLINLYKKK